MSVLLLFDNMNVDTKLCPNCRTEILINNFVTHSIHCERYFYFCTKCRKSINRNKKEEHDEYHLIINCSKCCLHVEKGQMKNHLQNDCIHRHIKCNICNLDIKLMNLNEHEEYCSSRTEKCSGCGKFVMFRCKNAHLNSGHAIFNLSDEESGPSSLWRNGQRQLGDFMPTTFVSQASNMCKNKKVKGTFKTKNS